jgi:hypothetical protein
MAARPARNFGEGRSAPRSGLESRRIDPRRRPTYVPRAFEAAPPPRPIAPARVGMIA